MEGGVGAFTDELAKALANEGYLIHILTSRQARPTDSRRSIWDPHDPVNIGYAQLHPRSNRWWWSSNNMIAEVTLRYALDIVNLQYQAAAFDMKVPAINFLPWRLRGLSHTVVTFHDLQVPYLFPKSGRLRTWVVYRLAQLADGIIVTNGHDLTLLREQGVPEGKIREIPIGSNIRAVPPLLEKVTALRKELGLSEKDYLLGYFGFLNPSKGVEVLIDALGRLGERYHLIFIGATTGSSDPTNADYKAQIEEMIRVQGLGDRVHESGFLPDEGLSTFFHAADLLVMPYRDGVSLRRGTLMAILAHGRPLITTQPKTAIPELIHGQNVWLAPVDDPEALKEAIKRLAADPEKRNQLGVGAKQLSQLFTWDKIAKRTSAFYEEIIAQNQ